MAILKDNLVIQFLAVFFGILVILAVVTSLILTTQVNETTDLMEAYDSAVRAGVVVKATDSFSIPSLIDGLSDFRWTYYRTLGGGFAILYFALILIVWRGWVTIERQRGELVKHAVATAREDELRSSRQRIVAAQESTRRDIAQQLHGSVQNRLVMLILRMKELETKEPTAETLEVITDLRSKFEELLETEIRSISHQLYPTILRRGLIPALESLGDRFERIFPVRLELEEGLREQERSDHNLVPEPVRLTAYRIVEEAVSNVVKYAQATQVTIAVDTPAEGRIRLRIQDDGEGFDVDKLGDGLGLAGMRDYVEVGGGELSIRSAPGDGTEVTATLPL